MITRFIGSIPKYSRQAHLHHTLARSFASDCSGVQPVITNGCATSNRQSLLRKAPVTVTDMAVDKIKRFIEDSGNNPRDYGLRVGIEKNGCSGNSYLMDIGSVVEAEQMGDNVYDEDGAKVIIKKKDEFGLFGLEIDYEQSIFRSGLKIDNPNVVKSCSCGSSFKLKTDQKKRRQPKNNQVQP